MSTNNFNHERRWTTNQVVSVMALILTF